MGAEFWRNLCLMKFNFAYNFMETEKVDWQRKSDDPHLRVRSTDPYLWVRSTGYRRMTPKAVERCLCASNTTDTLTGVNFRNDPNFQMDPDKLFNVNKSMSPLDYTIISDDDCEPPGDEDML